MKLLPRILLIGLVVGALAFAACGDDDGEENGSGGNGSPSPTASRSPSATSDGDGTPAASPDGTGSPGATQTPRPTQAAPTPSAPGLDPGVNKIGEGTMTFVLAPSGQFSVDGLALVRPGVEKPPCEAFVFAFSWQITDPFPAGGNSVTWRLTQDGPEDVGSGASGSASVGCGPLLAVNMGADEVTVNVHYLQGAIQG